jgi:hypothetical protein
VCHACFQILRAIPVLCNCFDRCCQCCGAEELLFVFESTNFLPDSDLKSVNMYFFISVANPNPKNILIRNGLMDSDPESVTVLQ